MKLLWCGFHFKLKFAENRFRNFLSDRIVVLLTQQKLDCVYFDQLRPRVIKSPRRCDI